MARTALAAAERNFEVEVRIFDVKFDSIDKAMKSKKRPRLSVLEAKQDKASAQLTRAYQKVLMARCELAERCCMTCMAKLEQRNATLRSLKRRLRRRKMSALWPRSSWLRKALV